MKTVLAVLFLLCAGSVVASQLTQQQIFEYNECFPVLRELREIKHFRDQNMESGGKKSLVEIERDLQSKATQMGCDGWRNEFNSRNP
ncbi:MAG: hypothetical protein LLG15_01490 [Betaproteobacteria bacterium]|nr:hypothetical protein [Betaproteobacteria bacterium]